MKNYFEKEFELRYFEMDSYGQASSTSILTLLEETAASHCSSINHSLFDLEKQNIGWVLLSGVMTMDRYPDYNEKIIIRTWLSDYSTVKGIRENIIYDGEMNIIGKSKGLWVFYDIKRRRPVQIFDSIKSGWSYCTLKSTEHDIRRKILPLESSLAVNEFRVNRYDVDTNLHLNNIRYLQWLSESISEDIIDNYYLHSIDGRFISEAKYGDTILSFTEKDTYENSFIHTMRTQKDNRVCATAKTLWKKRPDKR